MSKVKQEKDKSTQENNKKVLKTINKKKDQDKQNLNDIRKKIV